MDARSAARTTGAALIGVASAVVIDDRLKSAVFVVLLIAAVNLIAYGWSRR